MHAASLLCLAVIAAASPLVNMAQPDPSCTKGKMPAVMQSISSAHAHPTYFCSEYLHIPPNVHTVTHTADTATMTGSTSVCIETTTSYTSTFTTFALVENTACVSGVMPSKKAKRGADILANSKRTYKAVEMSSACSCIYPHTTGILSTTTATVTPQTTVLAVTTTTTIVSAVKTITLAASATGTPFHLQVSSFTSSTSDTSSGDYGSSYGGYSSSSSSSDPTGMFLNTYWANSLASYDITADTYFALNTCNELTVVGSASGTNYDVLNSALTAGSHTKTGFDHLEFYDSDTVAAQQDATARCSVDEAGASISCSMECGGESADLFVEYMGRPAISTVDDLEDGAVTYSVIFKE